jgi:hypothetical protein
MDYNFDIDDLLNASQDATTSTNITLEEAHHSTTPEETLSSSEFSVETIPSSQYEKLDSTEPAYSFLRYFHYNKGDTKAKCRLCNNTIGRKDGTTTGMDKHLKSKHSALHREYEKGKQSKKRKGLDQDHNFSKTPPKQPKLTDFEFKQVEKWATNHPKSQKLDHKILRYICLSCKPLSTTEDSGFSEILEEACPR